jgi:hypothetical protein
LKLKTLITSQKIIIPFPKKIQTIIMEGNFQVNRISYVILDDFINVIFEAKDSILMTLSMFGKYIFVYVNKFSVYFIVFKYCDYFLQYFINFLIFLQFKILKLLK